MSHEDVFARVDLLLGRIEKLWKLAVGITVCIAGGVAWGGRLEWSVSQLSEDMKDTKAQVRTTSIDVSRIKGHLGVAHLPIHQRDLDFMQAWKGDEPDQEQQ